MVEGFSYRHSESAGWPPHLTNPQAVPRLILPFPAFVSCHSMIHGAAEGQQSMRVSSGNPGPAAHLRLASCFTSTLQHPPAQAVQ